MTHNGYFSTSSFIKDGKKATLASLTPSQLQMAKPQKDQDRSNLLLTCSEPILRVSHHEFKAFMKWILVKLEETEPSKLTHPLADSLLK